MKKTLNRFKSFANKVQIIIKSMKFKVQRNYYTAEKADNFKVFQEIYSNNVWGGDLNSDELYSGGGSHDPNIINPYIEYVNKFLNSFESQPVVVDLGCGDFNVGSQIYDSSRMYFACDVAPELIEQNKRNFTSSKIKFLNLDITKDPLPAGDVVLLRQVFQHLSNSDISKVLNQILSKYTYLILTEHLPNSFFVPNMDKVTGGDIRLNFRSGVVLTKAPFNLEQNLMMLSFSIKNKKDKIETSIYKLI
jgi:hypothetical protein